MAWAVADQLPRFRPFALPNVLASFAHLGHHPGEAWALCVLTAMRPALAATAALMGAEGVAGGPVLAATAPVRFAEEATAGGIALMGVEEEGKPVTAVMGAHSALSGEADRKLPEERPPDAVRGNVLGVPEGQVHDRSKGNVVQEGGEQVQNCSGGQIPQLPAPAASEHPYGVRAASSCGRRSAAATTAEAMLAPCDAIAMSQLLWALGKLGQKPLDSAYTRELLGALSARLPEMNAQGVSNSLWGESTAGWGSRRPTAVVSM